MVNEEGIIAGTMAFIFGALGIGAYLGRDKLGQQNQPQGQRQAAPGSPPQATQSASAAPASAEGSMTHNVLAVRAVDSNGQAIRGAIVIAGTFEGYADSDGVCLIPMRGPQAVAVEVHKPHNGKNGPGVQYPIHYKGGIHTVTIPVTERDD